MLDLPDFVCNGLVDFFEGTLALYCTQWLDVKGCTHPRKHYPGQSHWANIICCQCIRSLYRQAKEWFGDVCWRHGSHCCGGARGNQTQRVGQHKHLGQCEQPQTQQGQVSGNSIQETEGKKVVPPPLIPGITRVEEFLFLGIKFGNNFSVETYVNEIIGSCARTLYALRILCAHGMNIEAIHSIFK